MEDVRICFEVIKKMLRKIFSRENLIALMLSILILLVIILSADTEPQWIYQGF